jgi:hypothetical protein
MFRSAMLLVGGWVILCGAPLGAQEAVLGQMYGSGVHAYFAGDYVRAHQYLTSAIEGHTQDARCYYFRGLACLKLGRPQDAELDFQQGAKLECSDLNRTYNVAKSLERVQGADRSAIEQYRVAARMLAMTRAEAERKARYEQTQKQEQQLLTEQASRAAEKPGEPEVVARPPIEDPFAAGGGAAKPQAPEAAAPKPEEAKTETPAEKPAAEQAAAEKPAAEKPAAEPAEKAEAKSPADNPFTTPAKAATEPAEKAEAKSPAEDPFASPATPAAEPAKSAPEAAPATGPAPAKPAADGGKGGSVLGAMGHALRAVAPGGAAPDGAAAKPAPAKAGAAAPVGGPPATKAEAEAGGDPFSEGLAPAAPAKAAAEPAKPAAPDSSDPLAPTP